MFKRKAYDRLLSWKKEYNGTYACLLEGARRVGIHPKKRKGYFNPL